MTPKEKAKEIINKFLKTGMMIRQAKECALICVYEVISSSPSLPILADNGSFGSDIEESTKWWKEVKEEILKI